MRVGKIKLKEFKRFDDLTISLGNNPKKVIALVGPNGCGKSSIFDAFEEELKNHKHAKRREEDSFFSKLFYSALPKKTDQYDRSTASKIWKDDGTQEFNKKSFYIRTAYRFTSNLKVESITAQPDIIDDTNRPHSSNALDSRLQENYPRLLGQVYDDVFKDGNKTGTQILEERVGKINIVLEKILDVRITNLGNITARKGQIFFEKGSSKDFPYDNLSSGEKEVVDIIVDLIVKTPEYNDTVFCIDEPELHLNTAIQRKLLIEIEKLIPDNCQLWVATHSIGFLRALQEELKDKSQILDFSEKDYFEGSQLLEPIKPTRQNWQRIFSTALEDLTGLISPKRIIYCEGRVDPTLGGLEQGLDANVYNSVFEEEFGDTLFVSSGGNEAQSYAALALKVISKAFIGVNIFLLKDRDGKSDADRLVFLSLSTNNRMLERHEIENYLLDKEIIDKVAASKGKSISASEYSAIVSDPIMQDFKSGSTIADLKVLAGYSGTNSGFKLELSKYITPDTNVYKELKSLIF